MQPIVDVCEYDVGGKPNWPLLVGLGAPWHGAIIKATEGTYYGPAWFDSHWKKVRDAAGERYGTDWFRGAYHFLKFDTDGAKQADLYLSTVERAGGWDSGDLWPIVDVELGNERNSNRKATSPQVIKGTQAFTDRTREVTGRKVMFYGNGAMRDLGIKVRMGCDYLWCPRYTATLSTMIYERAGWTRNELIMWQYSGAGESYLAGYASSPAGFGKCDVSVLVKEGEIEWLRANL